MKRLQLKTKKIQLSSRPVATKHPDVLSNVLSPNKNYDEEDALILLLKKYEEVHGGITLPKNQWMNLEFNLPPNTSETIVLFDPFMNKSKLLYSSHVFLKFHLLNKYMYSNKNDVFSHITHFMVLDDPND